MILVSQKLILAEPFEWEDEAEQAVLSRAGLRLRTGLLPAIGGMGLKGADSVITQAMCLLNEAFGAAAGGQKLFRVKFFWPVWKKQGWLPVEFIFPAK